MRGIDVVGYFEEEVAEYCGSNFAVAVNSCTNAIGLCLQYLKAHNGLPKYIDCPAHTYLGVPMQIVHAGAKINWRKDNRAWTDQGYYHLAGTPIIDSARLFTTAMYIEETLMCTSHHWSKTLGMEQGGCILTDDIDAAEWLCRARSDGRYLERSISGQVAYDQIVLGWHCYMSPETAAAGLQRMTWLPTHNAPLMTGEPEEMYPDLSELSCFKPYTWDGKS